MNNKWDLRFMELADVTASWSKDTRTKVGSVIVKGKNPISMGFNGFPAGVKDLSERFLPPEKYDWTIHSEANSIVQAAKNGQKTEGCVMYVTLFPCCNCAGLIVNAGIKKVICKNKPDFSNEKYGKSWKTALTIFEEAGITVEYLNEEIISKFI